MKIVCYAHATHQKESADRFMRGLTRHGLTASLKIPQEPEDCDLAVFWGHRQHGIISKQRREGKHYLVMERGYIGDRFKWTSLGFDGLNGRAKFPKIDDGMKRWNQHFAGFLKPWKENNGKTAVIMGQVRGDESLRTVDFEKWVINIADSVEEAGFSIWFRPHPGEPCYRPKNLNVMKGALSEALDAAELVVTYNSNSGVDAVIAGVPTFAADPGSMVWNIYTHDLAPINWNRDEWCKKMAYTQWLPEEIESGAAWEALRTVI